MKKKTKNSGRIARLCTRRETLCFPEKRIMPYRKHKDNPVKKILEVRYGQI
jgi:hypothetical protein